MFAEQQDSVQSMYYDEPTALGQNKLELAYSSNDSTSPSSETETSDGSLSSHHFPLSQSYMEPAIDDTDDLLYHFGIYFKEKLHKEVNTFCGSLSSMFSEQQIHVKQIVNAARNYDLEQQSVTGMSSNTTDIPVFQTNDTTALVPQFHNSNVFDEMPPNPESKERYIIHLLMLSSMISFHLYKKSDRN